jgi:putative flippase GtrA
LPVAKKTTLPRSASEVRHAPFLRRLFRFGLSGLLVTGIHTIIAGTLINVDIASPTVANGVAFAVATLISYVINTVWSFSSPLRGQTLARFVAVSFFGLLAAMLVAYGAQQLGWHYLFGIAAVAMTVPPITFLLHSFWTYK